MNIKLIFYIFLILILWTQYSSSYAIEEFEKDAAVVLPDSVKEYLELKDKKDETIDENLMEVARSRAIIDIKNYGEMSVAGKDSIRGLQYYVIGSKLFPFRKDIINKKTETLAMAIKSTNELSKSKTKDCSIILSRISYIISIAPDVVDLENSLKSCNGTDTVIEQPSRIIAKLKRIAVNPEENISVKIPQQKLILSEEACLKGNARMCFYLGNANLISYQKEMALKYFSMACEKGDMEGCYTLGYDESSKGNINNARKLYLKTCNGGFMLGCYAVGALEVKKGNSDEGMKYFKKSCEGKYLIGCIYIGFLENKKGHDAISKQWYAKACNGGQMVGCFAIGEIERKKGNKTEAKKWYSLACVGNDMAGCTYLGFIEGEMGNIQNEKKLYLKACNGGEKIGCYSLGVLAEIKSNKDEAIKWYSKACDATLREGCSSLGDLERKNGNITEAKKLYIKACNEKDSGACYNLACFFSLENSKGNALIFLEKSLVLGYSDWKNINSDKDLDPIRNEERFRELILKYKK